MFHCHNLIHEDHAMLAAFNVTLLESLGYDLNSTLNFANPMDTRFAAQKYNASAYTPDAISSAVESLASLGAYQAASSVATSLSSKSTSPSTTSATTTDAASATASTTAAATTTKKHKKHKTRVKVHKTKTGTQTKKHHKKTTTAAAATSTAA
jgi:FtsP/CotA-like multicopper oxidase with cupredoxin domain